MARSFRRGSKARSQRRRRSSRRRARRSSWREPDQGRGDGPDFRLGESAILLPDPENRPAEEIAGDLGKEGIPLGESDDDASGNGRLGCVDDEPVAASDAPVAKIVASDIDQVPARSVQIENLDEIDDGVDVVARRRHETRGLATVVSAHRLASDRNKAGIHSF